MYKYWLEVHRVGAEQTIIARRLTTDAAMPDTITVIRPMAQSRCKFPFRSAGTGFRQSLMGSPTTLSMPGSPSEVSVSREFHSGYAAALIDGKDNQVAVLAAPLFFVGVEVTEAERLPTRIRLFAAGVFGWCACCVLGAESETLTDQVVHALV